MRAVLTENMTKRWKKRLTRKQMKTNNNKWIALLAISLAFTTVLSVCRTSKGQAKNSIKKQIIAYSRCSTEDASSDILYSINQIKGQLSKKKIVVKIDKQKKRCGYLFINGTKRKMISSSLTDTDLLQEVNNFYGN
jgi:hypothetical protein